MKHTGKSFHTDENSKNNMNIENEELIEKESFDESTQQEAEVYDVEESTVPAQSAAMSVKEKRKMIKAEKKLRNKQAKAEKTEKEKPQKEKPLKKEKKPIPVKKVKTKQEKVKNEKVIPFNSKHSSHSAEKDGKFSSFLENIKFYKKNIILATVIILVLFVVVMAFANRDRLTFTNIKNWVEYGVFNKNSEEHFPIPTNGDIINQGNFTHIDSNLVYASDTKFATLNNFGRTIYSYNQTFSSPVLTKANDCDLTIVYDLGGKDFSINNLDSTIYSGEAEDDIIGADVSKSGVYALVTTKDGYMSKLYVYSKDHKQIYAYSFADFYITSVSIDSRGKTAVLTGISAHDGSQLSSIYLLDFTKEEPLFFEEIQENILYYVEHLDNSHACIIGENAAYTLSTRMKSLKTFSYDAKTLTAFDVNMDTDTFSLSLSRSGDGRMCDIYSFSSKGVLKKTISTELMITSLSTYKNRVAALDTDTVYLYTKDGNLLSEKVAGLDPNAVVLYSTTDAYILGVSEIRRLDLR